MEGIGAAWRFRIAKMVPFRYPRWPPWQPSWKSSNHICYRIISLSLNMMGGIWVLWKFRIAKILLFQCPRWPPSWNSSNQISSQTARLSQNLMGGIGVTWRFRIAESFSSSIQDDGHGGNLETLQTTSDSELLKAIWPDSQDGHHGTM